MIKEINKEQEQRIINIIQCMQENNIVSAKVIIEKGLSVYLTFYIKTVELEVITVNGEYKYLYKEGVITKEG